MPHDLPALILLGGSSGAGKSYLAERHGRPHVVLDNFYRELAEHTPDAPLPVTPYGEVDWDDPGTWNRDAAVDSMMELLESGQTQVPDYSISTSSYNGYTTVSLDGGPVVAEGIFVDQVLAPLRALGVEPLAVYIDVAPVVTAVRRFVRDVRERRKPVPFLLKRGWALFRAEGALRRRYVDAGFTPLRKRRVKALLAGR
ncbi:uridine kinase family protein [Zafaria sp. Z1313]|uniref:uridine kinase family protein n=1 Tax=unclassified Zafaria TaxID=2828765 RepID=UPI002E76C849|nr:uridine kinase [Zafaria sp. J156]MEE1621083.1 uridine kinase [Zafaria sp. J156]